MWKELKVLKRIKSHFVHATQCDGWSWLQVVTFCWVIQNCEYKSTLPRTIDEFFTYGDGVLKFNAHKLNVTNKKMKIENEITNWITKLIWMMTFLIDIIYEQQWESKWNY